MKKSLLFAFCFLLFAFCFLPPRLNAQSTGLSPEFIVSIWDASYPLFSKNIKDPLIKEILKETPKYIVRKDYENASLSVTQAIYKTKGVKVLNKEYIVKLKTDFQTIHNALFQNKFDLVASGLLNIGNYTLSYLEKGILSQEAPQNTPQLASIPVAAPVEKLPEISKSLFVNSLGDYSIYMDGQTYESQNQGTYGNYAEYTDILMLNDNLSIFIDKSQSAEFDVNQQGEVHQWIQDNSGLLIHSIESASIFVEGKQLKKFFVKGTNQETDELIYLDVVFFYSEKNESTYGVFAYIKPSNGDFQTYKNQFETILTTFNINENTAKKFFNIKSFSIVSIQIDGISQNKPSGETWDNAWSNYSPDVYFTVDNGDGTNLYRLPIERRTEDLIGSKLWNFSQGPISLWDTKSGFSVSFYDYDSQTDDDVICELTFDPLSQAMKTQSSSIKLTESDDIHTVTVTLIVNK
ncbi:MAG: hypothetical protein ACK51A_01870 [Sphingobacteriia bacterium]|jgi:hypothetical protein